ncbi:MAG: hypothetical protein ACOX86_03890 [Pelotomaculaceae bacterium]|uniref:Uncharacterized protein n=1 Tax=anaerobic digester metagenome TaxID=1263854 RepID=A0A485M0V2_9ZZZZ|nr:hypothetical protein [Bacillota bacterium]HHU85225.1 hypothetical protein [Peptococcaceae bacterium]
MLYLEKILLKELLDVRRMMLKEIMREIEIEIKKKGQTEAMIEEAWAAHAKKTEAQRVSSVS